MSKKMDKKAKRDKARKKKKAVELNRHVNAKKYDMPGPSLRVDIITPEMIENILDDNCRHVEGYEKHNTDHLKKGEFDLQGLFIGDIGYVRLVDYQGVTITVIESQFDSLREDELSEFERIMRLGETENARAYITNVLGGL
ncbi:MAG: hypothetical protein RPU41_00630 [Candidatus Sedimenticola sp. (ex Thyasira tokunagai)]